jgi:hypothetical protein
MSFAPADTAWVSGGLVVFSTAKPGVSVSGGHSTDTVMPYGLSSLRNASENPTTANLDAQ